MKMRTKSEILEELKQVEEQEKQEFMDNIPPPPNPTVPKETKGSIEQVKLEYKITYRRLKDIEEQLGKRNAIVENSEFRTNLKATRNEMLNKRDIVRFQLNIVKQELLASGVNVIELEKEE